MNSTRGKESKIRVLVACADYPDENGNSVMMYVHVRNQYYISHNIDVTVLSFKATFDYTIDDIKVISLKTYQNQDIHYDLLICHAPNIRNHYLFLKKYGKQFSKFIFFFHGHEVLRTKDVYPEPYAYRKVKKWNKKFRVGQQIYDTIKLELWKNYFPKMKSKSILIFVSDWMKKKFEKYVGLSLEGYESYIIPNSVGETFQVQSYDFRCTKKYDFITIRNNLDGSKYCIDIINNLAFLNKELKFLVVGKGEYFSCNKKAPNICLIDKELNHVEIAKLLNTARCALMPTRLDAQGVMMCEMATYGIPVLTSNIDICRELKKIFSNFILLKEEENMELHNLLDYIPILYNIEKNTYFFQENTIGKEVHLIKNSRHKQSL